MTLIRSALAPAKGDGKRTKAKSDALRVDEVGASGTKSTMFDVSTRPGANPGEEMTPVPGACFVIRGHFPYSSPFPLSGTQYQRWSALSSSALRRSKASVREVCVWAQAMRIAPKTAIGAT